VQLGKAKEEGHKWSMYTNFMIVILLGLLALQGTVAFQSYKQSIAK